MTKLGINQPQGCCVYKIYALKHYTYHRYVHCQLRTLMSPHTSPPLCPALIPRLPSHLRTIRIPIWLSYT